MPRFSCIAFFAVSIVTAAAADPSGDARPFLEAAHAESLEAIRDPAHAVEHWRAALEETERGYALVRGTDAEVQALALLAERALHAGELEKARRYAKLALDTGREYAGPGLWSVGNAQHHGHLVLGMVALAEEDREGAVRHLLAAGETRGSPQLDTFGPNMDLARALLELGERQGVLDYFERCRGFWRLGVERGTLDRWTDVVESGGIPDFGANLVYGR